MISKQGREGREAERRRRGREEGGRGREGGREGKRILGGKRRVGELFKDTVAYIRNIKKTEIHILIEENFLDMLNENGDIYKFKPNQVKS